jgi:hypothetical protein
MRRDHVSGSTVSQGFRLANAAERVGQNRFQQTL